MAAHGRVRTPVGYPTRSRPTPLAQREWGGTTPLVIPSGVVEWGGRYPVGFPHVPTGAAAPPQWGQQNTQWGVKPPTGVIKTPSREFSLPSRAIEPAHWGEATAHCAAPPSAQLHYPAPRRI